jgi:hypothetical protein
MRALFVAAALPSLSVGADPWASLRLSYFPGRDDCNPTYRPLDFGDIALVVNCQWSMANVEEVLAELERAQRRAVLSDHFILYRSEAALDLYRRYRGVLALFYAADEPLWKAVSGTATTPGAISAQIDSAATVARVNATIATVGQKITKFRSIAGDVPVFVNEAKPIFNQFDRNYNISGGDPSKVWTNFTLHAVNTMHEYNRNFLVALGFEFDFYGFDWYDSTNVTENTITFDAILTGLKTTMPNTQHHRYVLYPFLIQDDFGAYNRQEFLMNRAIVDLALGSWGNGTSYNGFESFYNVALLFVWTGTKEMRAKKTLPECEQYLLDTPPAGFALLETLGRALDRGWRDMPTARSGADVLV